MKKKKQSGKQIAEESAAERILRYENSPYFKRKDEQAIEFMKKHPIPPDLLERHTK